MQSLARRIAALEVAAKLLEKRVMSPKPALSFEEVKKKMDEILTRERPARTRVEVIADFTAYASQRHADWELRHGQS